jgi:hypothetical protein
MAKKFYEISARIEHPPSKTLRCFAEETEALKFQVKTIFLKENANLVGVPGKYAEHWGAPI